MPTDSTGYSLWKATTKLKLVKKKTSPFRTSYRTWARSNVEKAHAFTEHLVEKFFNHIPQKINPKRKKYLSNF
jgi:hypothetical protein